MKKIQTIIAAVSHWTAAAAMVLLLAVAMIPLTAQAETADYNTADGKWEQVDDSTWVQKDDQGEVLVTMVKNGDQWEYSFKVASPNDPYYGWEVEVPDGYEVQGKGVRSDPAYAANGANGLEIINSQKSYTQVGTGGLSITKTVKEASGATATGDNTSFLFTVTLETTDTTLQNKISGTQTFGGVVFKDGVGSFSLQNGKSVPLDGIPEGIKWTVQETPVTGYTAAMTGDGVTASGSTASGVIKTNTTPAVTCTNTKAAVVQEKTGSFTVQKTTVNGVTGDTFSFLAVLQDLKANTAYQLELTNSAGTKTETFKSGPTGVATVTFTLEDGGKAAFKDLPKDAHYSVTEEASAAYTASYAITSADTSKTVTAVKDSDENKIANKALSTANETVDEDEDALITFTNTKPYTGGLVLAKTIEGDGLDEASKNTEFTFTVNLTQPETAEDGTVSQVPVTGSYTLKTLASETGTAYTGNLTFTDGTAKISLKGGQYMYIDGLLEDSEYTIKEESYRDWQPEVTTGSLTGTIPRDANAKVSVKNVWIPDRTLTITKKVTGNMGSRDKAFDFTVTLKAPNGQTLPTSISIKMDGQEKILTRDAKGQWTFQLAHGSSIEMTLRKGYTYSIVETGADDYETTYRIDSGAETTDCKNQPLDNDAVVTVTNTKEMTVPTLAITNTMASVGMLVAGGLILLFLIWKYMIRPYLKFTIKIKRK